MTPAPENGCPGCGLFFPGLAAEAWRRHRQICSALPAERTCCPLCDYSNVRPEIVMEHVETAHAPNRKTPGPGAAL